MCVCVCVSVCVGVCVGVWVGVCVGVWVGVLVCVLCTTWLTLKLVSLPVLVLSTCVPEGSRAVYVQDTHQLPPPN